MFEAPDIDDVLATALRAAIGPDARGVMVQASPPERIDHDVARIPVCWRTEDRTGRETTGNGSLLVLVVQSGHHAVTEVLATVPVHEEQSRQAAVLARRFLEEITATLAAAAPARHN